MRAVGLALAIVLFAVCWSDSAAYARPTAGATPGQGGIDSVARDESDGGAESPRGGSGVTCTSIPVTDPAAIAAMDQLSRSVHFVSPTNEGPGSWYRRTCRSPDGSISFSTIIWRPAPAAPDPLAMAEEARRNLPLPLPSMRMAPDADSDHVVNGPATWLWVADGTWAPQSSTVTAGGVTVVVTAVPTAVVWDMGDGSPPIRCLRGTPYDPHRQEDAQTTECSHVWRRSSQSQPGGRFIVRATATWHATFTVTGVPGVAGGDLGDIDRGAGLAVNVIEGEAVNTRPPARSGG